LATTSSRLALIELTRKSSGAGVFNTAASSSASCSPYWATNLSYSHCGRLARIWAGSKLRSIWRTRARNSVSSSLRPPSASTPTASAMPSKVRRRIGPWPEPAKSVKKDLLRSTA
jgi:hypothetical protein